MTSTLEAESHGMDRHDPALPPRTDESADLDHIFSYHELARLDEALTMSSRETGLRFTLYIGDLGKQTRIRAEEMAARIEAMVKPIFLGAAPQPGLST